MSRVVLLACRVAGAVSLGATAAIHLYLWGHGYRGLAWIGPLFLLDAGAAALLATAVLAARPAQLPWAAAAATAVQLGTLSGLVLAVTTGVFGFVESTRATLLWPSVVVEAAGGLVLSALTVSAVHAAAGAPAHASRLRRAPRAAR